MRTKAAWAAALLAALGAAGGARGESIYARANRAGTSPLTTDDTARRVGDLLTVTISEESSATNTTNRDLEKKTSRTATANGSFDFGTVFGNKAKTYNLPTVDANTATDSKFEGKNGYDSSRKIADSMTVTVYDVLPNGNLVIMGTRRRQVDGDTQFIQISGIVRPNDVLYPNTVSSSQIAEFQWVTSDAGQGSTFTRPGWLGSFMNQFSPE